MAPSYPLAARTRARVPPRRAAGADRLLRSAFWRDGRGQPWHVPAPALIRRFPARAEHVGPARREVTAYARRHGVRDPDGVALAVSEAVTNAVLHAYVGAATPGEVELVARCLVGDGLEVVVSD